MNSREWVKPAIFAVGLILSYFHWAGLIIGGLALGLMVKGTAKALLSGFVFGLAVWIAFVAVLSASGIAGKFIAMNPLPYLSLLLTVVTTTISASITNFFSPSR